MVNYSHSFTSCSTLLHFLRKMFYGFIGFYKLIQKYIGPNNNNKIQVVKKISNSFKIPSFYIVCEHFNVLFTYIIYILYITINVQWHLKGWPRLARATETTTSVFNLTLILYNTNEGTRSRQNKQHFLNTRFCIAFLVLDCLFHMSQKKATGIVAFSSLCIKLCRVI